MLNSESNFQLFCKFDELLDKPADLVARLRLSAQKLQPEADGQLRRRVGGVRARQRTIISAST